MEKQSAKASKQSNTNTSNNVMPVGEVPNDVELIVGGATWDLGDNPFELDYSLDELLLADVDNYLTNPNQPNGLDYYGFSDLSGGYQLQKLPRKPTTTNIGPFSEDYRFENNTNSSLFTEDLKSLALRASVLKSNFDYESYQAVKDFTDVRFGVALAGSSALSNRLKAAFRKGYGSVLNIPKPTDSILHSRGIGTQRILPLLPNGTATHGQTVLDTKLFAEGAGVTSQFLGRAAFGLTVYSSFNEINYNYAHGQYGQVASEVGYIGINAVASAPAFNTKFARFGLFGAIFAGLDATVQLTPNYEFNYGPNKGQQVSGWKKLMAPSIDNVFWKESRGVNSDLVFPTKE